MTKEQLIAKREQMVANLNSMMGAIQLLDQLIAEETNADEQNADRS